MKAIPVFHVLHLHAAVIVCYKQASAIVEKESCDEMAF